MCAPLCSLQHYLHYLPHYLQNYNSKGLLLSHKKNEIFPFVTTRIVLEIIMLSEASQTKKDKYFMIPHICEIWETNKKWTNIKKQKQSHRYRQQTTECWREIGKISEGNQKAPPPVIRWIVDKDVIYWIGNMIHNIAIGLNRERRKLNLWSSCNV